VSARATSHSTDVYATFILGDYSPFHLDVGLLESALDAGWRPIA
jgi:hypothetical protein